MRNFVRDTLALQDCMIREELTANEYILLMAIYRIWNDRRFPDGPLAIGLNQLLSFTSFNGSRRDNTLRETRDKLAARGLLRVEKGAKGESKATYEIIWDAVLGQDQGGEASEPEDTASPEDAPEGAPEDAAQSASQSAAQSAYKKCVYYVNVNQKGDAHTRCIGVSQAARAREADRAEKAELSTGLSTSAAKTQRNELPVCEEVIAVDNAWKYSPRARCAIAQRLLNAGDKLLERTTVVTDAGDILDGRDLFDVLAGAMAAGVSPGRCLALLSHCRESWEWEALLMDEVRRTGCTPPEWLERLRNLESCFPDWRPKGVRVPWQ